MNSIFSILGPVMIGPSSSHTAGAEKIGRIVYMLTGGDLERVEFTLHGSFAKTGRGHGTDKALVAGILGMEPYDERIKDAIHLAEEKGIEIRFEEADLGNVHPNTVKALATKSDGTSLELVASSIGGGNISVGSINSVNATFTGKYTTLIISHYDKVGMISQITQTLAVKKVNIVTLSLTRESKGSTATSVIEVDSPVSPEILDWIQGFEHVISVIYMDKI